MRGAIGVLLGAGAVLICVLAGGRALHWHPHPLVLGVLAAFWGTAGWVVARKTGPQRRS